MAPAALLAGVLLGCGGAEEERERSPDAPVIESRQTGVKILLVGIDGATFAVLDPLLEAGALPTFERLIEGGARAPLLSDRPMKSPALWTTVSTGRDRKQHGVEQFTATVEGSDVPVLANATMRRTLTVWDMLGGAGRSVGRGRLVGDLAGGAGARLADLRPNDPEPLERVVRRRQAARPDLPRGASPTSSCR